MNEQQQQDFFEQTMIMAAALSVVVPSALFIWAVTMFMHTYIGQDAPLYPISPWRCLLSILIPYYMAVRGLRKKSLDKGGAVLGFFVGFIMMLSSYSFFAALFAFYYAGSKVTKYKAEKKKQIEHDYKEGGQRNWIQVICNGGIATSLSVLYMVDTGFLDLPLDFGTYYDATWMAMSVVGALACCCGDTFASEIGSVLGGDEPRLITSWAKVPAGTNGAVSLVGLISSAFGGFIVGCAYYITLLLTYDATALQTVPPQWPVILFAAIGGFLGSLIDSLLGATVQYSAYCSERKCIVHLPSTTTKHIAGWPLLDNDGVNMFSSLLTALLLPGICFAYWPIAHTVEVGI